MFVGDTGISRVIRRTLEVMKEIGSDDPQAVRSQGAVDLPTLQRYLNFWFSSSLDLFGGEISSNAAMTFANGIKGRPDEQTFADHLCNEGTLEIATPDGKGAVQTEQVPLRNAMNEILRQSYVKDCEIGLKRWNAMIKRAGHAFELRLPSTRFRRTIGSWASTATDPDGNLVTREEFDQRADQWLPSASDRSFVHSLMHRVVTPGKMAGWIAPPERGINNQPIDYEYVRL